MDVMDHRGLPILPRTLPTFSTNITCVCRKCYLRVPKMLPVSAENVTYVYPGCYLRLLKRLPVSIGNLTYACQKSYLRIYLRLVKILPTDGRGGVTVYLYENR